MKIRRVTHESELKKKNVAAYARVSTLKEYQAESFNTQVDYYTSYIQSVDDWNFVGVYADQGKSGLSAKKRPQFLQMISDAQDGKIDIILVKSISRFGRNSMEAQEYVHLLKEKNVEVRFEKEGISSFNPQSEMVFNFLTAAAMESSRSLSQNLRWANAKRAQQGIQHLGSNHVLGYSEVDGKLVPNEDAWIVKYIFEEYAAGTSAGAIVDYLNEKGARRLRSNKPWEPECLKSILNSPLSVGDRIIQHNAPQDFLTGRPDPTIPYDQYFIKNDHEPIVSREVWEAAQERVKREKYEREELNVHRKRNSHFMYGRLFCGECGSPLRRRSVVYQGVPNTRTWKCIDRCKGVSGNGCLCDIVTEEALFKKLYEELGLEWNGLDNVTEDDFKNIERVDLFKGFKLKVTLREARETA